MTSGTDSKRSLTFSAPGASRRRAARAPPLPARRSLHDLALAPRHVLVRRELAQPHRTARVELLCGDADLGTEAEALAVGEAGGRVHDHDRGVDLAGEAPGRVQVASDDRLGVTGAEPVDVIDRRIERSGHR